MTWRDLFAGIKAGALDGVYLFSGPEEFIKREALDALQAKLLPPGMEQLNLSVLEGAGAREVRRMRTATIVPAAQAAVSASCVAPAEYPLATRRPASAMHQASAGQATRAASQ